MFTNRLFNLIVAAVLVAMGMLAIQGLSRPAKIITNVGAAPLKAQSVAEAGAQGIADYVRAHSSSSVQVVPEASVQSVADYVQAHSNPSAQVVPDASVQSVADYIRLHSNDLSFREYYLGERYGLLPQGYDQQQVLREYWLGERYGQTP